MIEVGQKITIGEYELECCKVRSEIWMINTEGETVGFVGVRPGGSIMCFPFKFPSDEVYYEELMHSDPILSDFHRMHYLTEAIQALDEYLGERG